MAVGIGVLDEVASRTVDEAAARVRIGQVSMIARRYTSRAIEVLRSPERCRERWIAELYLVGTVRPRIALRNGEVVEARQGSDAVQRLDAMDEGDGLSALRAQVSWCQLVK